MHFYSLANYSRRDVHPFKRWHVITLSPKTVDYCKCFIFEGLKEMSCKVIVKTIFLLISQFKYINVYILWIRILKIVYHIIQNLIFYACIIQSHCPLEISFNFVLRLFATYVLFSFSYKQLQ